MGYILSLVRLNLLEPGVEPLVEVPVLLLQFDGCQILLDRPREVVEGEEESLDVELLEAFPALVHGDRGEQVVVDRPDGHGVRAHLSQLLVIRPRNVLVGDI